MPALPLNVFYEECVYVCVCVCVCACVRAPHLPLYRSKLLGPPQDVFRNWEILQ